MKMLMFAIVAAVLPVLVREACADAVPWQGRRLVWSDEFDGRALDATKWMFLATMNSSDCVYSNDSRTVRVDGSCLHLLVVPSGNPEKPWMLPRGVSTRDKMAFRYGYLEMRRMRLLRTCTSGYIATGASKGTLCCLVAKVASNVLTCSRSA